VQQNCSPQNVLFSDVLIMLILQGIPPLGGIKQRWGGEKTSHFLALNVNISQIVGDTAKVTIDH